MNHGFKLVEERQLSELQATARLLLHKKSGARLFHIQNSDDNKVFSISFRTPPIDNTGLTHILEHSVLCGSRKFPTKEPFVDLAKGSLNTFLNAMTFGDKTMYPVASKNEKDLYNLVDVYMDAVLYPKIYECPEIMMQEGWHYDVADPESDQEQELTYKGIVYNEMLGAFSSPEEILFSKITHTLYPDTAYRFESGGDPVFIPELTQQEFLDYHKNHYHPANSYIYFYGNGELDKMLEFLDHEYLSAFDASAVTAGVDFDDNCKNIATEPELVDRCSFSRLTLQQAFDAPVEKRYFYPVSSEEEREDGTYISLNFVVGNACDARLSMSMDILEYMLLETPASPVKRALLDAEIGRDVLGNYDEGLLQPMFNIVLKDSNEDAKEQFLQIVQESLQQLVEHGIDKKLVEASINSLEFKFREANSEDTPKGLLYGIRCMDSWLYDGDPFKHLEYESQLEEIKQLSEQGHFETLIQTYLLDNMHASVVLLIPKLGLAEETELQLKTKLAEYKAALSEQQLEQLLKENRRLLARQNATDSEEDKQKIPMISLADIKRQTEQLPFEERELQGMKVLYHKHQTNKIVYLDLLFDTSMLLESQLPYVALLSDVLGLMSTGSYDYQQLSNEIDIHTGGISFDVDAYEELETGRLHPKFIVETKALCWKLEKVAYLINEILHGTIFEDEKRLWEILMETKADIEVELVEEGHSVATKRLCSYFSSYASYMEKLTGLTYYNVIADLEIDFETRFEEIAATLREISQKIFVSKGMVASVTCGDEEYQQFAEVYPQIVDKLCENPVNLEYNSPTSQITDTESESGMILNEGIFNSSAIVNVAKGHNYRELGYSYHGRLQVLKNILSLDYLWNRVRVMGGAYGAFARFEMGGNAYFVSYRDPNLEGTIEVFDFVPAYVASFDASERELEKYIIGTISNLDQPLSPLQSAQRADELYFRKISAEDLQRERDEILTTDAAGIRAFSEMLSKLIAASCICVVGSESLIRQSKGTFTKIYNMFDNSN